MINCLIVDDEPVARGIIRNYCSHLPLLQIVAECSNAFEVKVALQTAKIDLMFVDINMPVMNGLSLLATIKNPPVVIFTTAYQEYAVNAFDLAACDYLLKPFALDRFMIAVDKAREKIQLADPAAAGNNQHQIKDSFFIRTEGKLVKVFFHDCLYAEAQGNYTRIVTIENSLLTKTPLSEVLDLLPPATFIRVHRSFIINKNKIGYIEGNRVFMHKYEIPISGVYKERLLAVIGINIGKGGDN
jgi:DNA-binding LytR/AlgR family response regulator